MEDKENKKGFLAKIFEKADKSLKEKADKKSCCCCCDDDKEGCCE